MKPEAEAKFALISRNLSEILCPQIIEEVLDDDRPLKIYWGTAPTGRPHLGYFIPMAKMCDFIRAGAEITILIADIHGILDNLKSSTDVAAYRTKFYQFAIAALLESSGIPLDKVRFVLGSSFQQTAPYMADFFKLCTKVTAKRATRASAGVVKQAEDPTMSGLMYPIMQTLDEQYTDCDAQLGGVDQRKLFAAAQEWLPKIGYKKRAHLMNIMMPGLRGGKMSSSEENSKIDILDSPEVITKKLRSALCEPKIADDNAIMLLAQGVLVPISAMKGERFIIERGDAEPLAYTIDDQQTGSVKWLCPKLCEDYMNDIVTPQSLKSAVTKAVIGLLAPVQAKFNASAEWQEVAAKAYPKGK